MSYKPFILKPEERKEHLDVVGVRVSPLTSETDIRDQQITLQSGDEGMGPPPHSHSWDESFYVTRGQVEFTCAGETTTCTPGTLVHVPAGTIHAFSFGPGGGEMLEITGRGSNALSMFTAVHRQIPPGPLDIAKVTQVLANNGVTLHL